MKIAFTIVLVFSLLGSSYAQTANAQKIVRYCEIICVQKFTIYKAKIQIDTGAPDPIYSFKDTSVLADLKKVNVFTTRIDAINYMTRLGWELVNTSVEGNVHFFLFKRSFDLEELKKL
ncbi:hypothetical protein ACX0G9_02895 [Flavitalea flava]